MPLEYYNLDSILTRGKCKGRTVREVYQYAPDYLDWIICNWEDFYIDINLFKDLPNPTPYTKNFTKIIRAKNFKVDMEEHSIGGFINFKADKVKDAIEYLKAVNNIPEKVFQFSEKAITALQEKIEYKFQKPDWKPIDHPDNIADSAWND